MLQHRYLLTRKLQAIKQNGWAELNRRFKVGTHLSSIYIIKHKVKLLRGLEGVVEAHKEGVLDIFQKHVAFCHDVVLL